MNSLIDDPTEAMAAPNHRLGRIAITSYGLADSSDLVADASATNARISLIAAHVKVVTERVKASSEAEPEDMNQVHVHRGFVVGLAAGAAGVSASLVGALGSAFGMDNWLFWAPIGFAALGLGGSSFYELYRALPKR